MQTCSAREYLGKRIKMTGFIKTQDIKNWAGMWLRIDGKANKNSLSFDNMQDRPIQGTTEWKQYTIKLDVPENAFTLNFGALLKGTGKVWFDDVKFEIIQTTEILLDPSNLDFEN